MPQLDDLQAYTNLELPRRGVVFRELHLGVTGDPNTGISAVLDAAPAGTTWLDSAEPGLWDKMTAAPTSWVQRGAGGAPVTPVPQWWDDVVTELAAPAAVTMVLNTLHLVFHQGSAALADDVVLTLPDVTGLDTGATTFFMAISSPNGRVSVEVDNAAEALLFYLTPVDKVSFAGQRAIWAATYMGPLDIFGGLGAWALHPIHGASDEVAYTRSVGLVGTAALPAHTATGDANTGYEVITANANAELILDGLGVSVVNDIGAFDRGVLLTGAGSRNGIWQVLSSGSPAEPWRLRRRWDCALNEHVTPGGYVYVYSGTTYAGHTFVSPQGAVVGSLTYSPVADVVADAVPNQPTGFTFEATGTQMRADMQPATDYLMIGPPADASVLRAWGVKGESSLIVRNGSASPLTLTAFFTDASANEITLDTQVVSAGAVEEMFPGEDFFRFALKVGDTGMGVRFTGGDVTGVSARAVWYDVRGIERQDTLITTSPADVLPAPAAGEAIVPFAVTEQGNHASLFFANYDLVNTPTATVSLSDGVATIAQRPGFTPFSENAPTTNGFREFLLDGGDGLPVLLEGWTLQASIDAVGTAPVYVYAFYTRMPEAA